MKHTYIEIHDIGDAVLCDLCNKDWTGNPTTGGFLFESKAVCPDCTPSFWATVKGYHEEDHIKAWCPEGMSFWQWCLTLRGGNNQIKIITQGDK